MKSSGHSLAFLQDKKKLRRSLQVSAFLALSSVTASHAATYAFEGGGTTTTPTSGNFSGTGFSPTLGTSGGSPVSTFSDTVTFAGGTAYNATDDFGATINANVLTFSNSAAVQLLRGSSMATGANSFTLGGTAPTINLNNSALVTNNLDLDLGATVAIAGTGSMTMSGTISDGGSGYGFTMGSTGTLTLGGAASYSGVTTLNSGTLATGASNVLSASSAVVFSTSAPAILSLGSTTQTASSISASTYVSGAEIVGNSYTASSLTVGSDNTSTTFADTISHTTIVKNGTGTLTIGGTGDNSSTAFIVNAGTLILDKASTSGAHAEGSGLTINGGTVQLATGGGGYELYVSAPLVVNGGTLDFNGQSDSTGYLSSTSTGGTVTNTSTSASTLTIGTVTTAVTYSGNITDNGTNGGSLALVKIGTGVQTFSGTNTYTGGTTVSAGTLELGAFASLPNSGAGTSVAAGATLAAAVGGTSTITSANIAALGANATFASGGLLGVDTTGGNFTVSDNLSGGFGLAKLGTNTLTLSGANTYSGGTTVSNGTLVASGVGALPSGGAVTISAGTLVASGPVGTLPTNSAVSIAGSLAGSASPTILSIRSDASGTISQGNNIAITSTSNGTSSGPTIDVRNNGGTTTGSVVAFGALSDGAAGTEYKGEINFTGANGYTESFTSLSLPGIGTSTFLLNPTTTSVSIGSVTNPATATGSDTLNLGGTSANNIITGAISDSATAGETTTVATENTGTWTLAGANTYTNNTIFGDGTMILTGSINAAAGSGTPNVLYGQGGSFVYSPAAGSGTTQYFKSFTLSDSTSSISNTVAGSTLVLGAISRSNNADVSFANITGAITTTTANVNGIIGAYATTGTGSNTTYATGAGTVAAYTGATAAANAAALGTTATTNYNLAAGGTAPSAASAYTIRYTGGTDTLTSTSSLTASGVMNAGGGTLTIGGGTVIPGAVGSTSAHELNVVTPNGNVTISSNITNYSTTASTFTAGGPGAVTLTGSNSYTGTTYVDSGALLLNTAASGTGAVAVYTNGTLLGNGIAPGGTTTIYANGTLAPGASVAANGTSAASPGILTLGALTLTNVGNGTLGSNVNILLSQNNSTAGAGAGTAYSQIITSGVSGTGALTLAGNLILTIGTPLTIGDKFFILLNSSTGTTSGSFANIGATGSSFTQGGDTFTINYADNGDSGSAANDVSLTVTGVPEPSTYAGGLVALCFTIWGVIRRRSSRAVA